jgi:hypothetical protein
MVPVADSISTEVSILSTKYAVSKAWIRNSRLQHTLEQVKTDIEKSVKGLNKETVINKKKIVKVPYLVEKPVKMPLSWGQKFLLWSGGIGWGMVVVWTVYKTINIRSFKQANLPLF